MEIHVNVIFDQQNYYPEGRDMKAICSHIDVEDYVYISTIKGTYPDNASFNVELGQELPYTDRRGVKVLKLYNRVESAYWYITQTKEQVITACEYVSPQLLRGEQGIPGVTGPTGPTGPVSVTPGPAGPTGPSGQGINMKGTVATVADLPSTGNQNGDGWVVLANGYVYVWSA